MRTLSYTQAWNRLAEMMDQVCSDHVPMIITRKNGQSIVVRSLEDYRALDETAYLLGAPKNAERLLRSVAELDAGRGEKRELLD